jgi:hypothetical protein
VTTVPVRRFELTKSLRFSGILEDDENIHRVIAGGEAFSSPGVYQDVCHDRRDSSGGDVGSRAL